MGDFNRGEPIRGRKTDRREACSAPESQQIMTGYYALDQAVHAKIRSYQALHADFQNLIELYAKAHKQLQAKDEMRADIEDQLLLQNQRIRMLEQENEDKEHSIRTLNAQLKDARAQVGNQLGHINLLQADLDEYKNRMEIVKENLKGQLEYLPTENKQAVSFIFDPVTLKRANSSSTRSTDSIQYDDTSRDESAMEEEEMRTPTRPTRRTSPMRRPLIGGPTAVRPQTRRVSSGVGVKVAARRSSGVARTPALKTITTTVQYNEARQQLKTTVAIKRNSCTPRSKNWTGGLPIGTRQHWFEECTGMTTKRCPICNVFFFRGKRAVRCTDCGQQVHDKCKQNLHVPCVPQTMTPRARSTKQSRLPSELPGLHEFCPVTAPMIPIPVLRCVVALEYKGLSAEGIYRIPGNKAMVTKALKALSEMKEVPKEVHLLHHQPSEVLTGCIKMFLANLRDSLIPKTSRKEFVDAVTRANYTVEDRHAALEKAIAELPQPNRDTLAYLCIHWRKVIAVSDINKMPLSNLARCLAPTVVGLHDLTVESTLRSAGDDTNNAIRVLETLLMMDRGYWEQHISFEDLDKSIGAVPKSATRRSVMNTSRPLWR